MHERPDEAFDDWLRERLSPPEISDDGFSERVVRRIHRGARRRRIILGCAVGAGALVAALTASPLLPAAAARLADLAAAAPVAMQEPVTALALGFAALGMGLVTLLED